jgi:hypothetical protein
MFSIRGFAVLALIFGTVASATAQQGDEEEAIPQAQLAVNYSYTRANAAPGNCGCFNLNGGSTEIAIRAFRNFSAVFDLTGTHAGTTSIPGAVALTPLLHRRPTLQLSATSPLAHEGPQNRRSLGFARDDKERAMVP